ncbi:phosphatidic acid phosphatase type 2/haloperoxidase [Mycena pura]|uniref:Phosphatidic acid phosphatase type 2/haloperoxidase n=1 Tax=Mycena pura TaxID=153505 RepID=A0AAD6YRK6_9AGAR|nr:phosphatidic acid phosphatase type 2/haloperoxidase [Mycena pura]
MWDLHHALLGLTLAFSLTGLIVGLVRMIKGRPRPDFLSRCNPFPNATNAEFFGLANVTVCQTPGTDEIILDGVRSFFSGHACLSSAGLAYNSLYWAGKLQLFNRKAYSSKAWLVFTPLLGSIWICLTRVADHRHHPSDVVIGFFFGLLPAYFFYRQFFPSLDDPESYRAYPPRFGETGQKPQASRWLETRKWFSSFSSAAADDGPLPLLPINRMEGEMGSSSSSSSRSGGVEADLRASGLITTPFADDKTLDSHSSGY